MFNIEPPSDLSHSRRIKDSVLIKLDNWAHHYETQHPVGAERLEAWGATGIALVALVFLGTPSATGSGMRALWNAGVQSFRRSERLKWQPRPEKPLKSQVTTSAYLVGRNRHSPR